MAAGLGFKDFVTGEVLTAADVDGYLMQGVWVFASAAARSAAVTSPQEGNISYLKDTNSTEYYSGSAWVAIGGVATSPGLVLIHTETFSAQTSVSVNNKFSATYDNYLIRMNNMTSSVNTAVNMRMRASGSDETSTNYKLQYVESVNTTNTLSRFTANTSFINVNYIQTTYQNQMILELTNPFNTKITSGWSTQPNTSAGAIEGYTSWHGLNTTTSYDGFTIFPTTGNITGSISVYGFAK